MTETNHAHLPTDEEPSAQQTSPPRRKLFKVLGLSLLALLVLVIVFHRPILFRLTRYFIVRAAEQQNLSLEYEMGGSIFTNLRITNLEGTPTEPGPMERLEIELLRLEYSLWGLIRNGLPGLLESATISNAHVVIDPAKSTPRKKTEEQQSLKFPALIPEQLSIENLNVTVHRPEGDLVLANFNLLLHPEREGWLRAERIELPGFHVWTDLDATATYTERNLVLGEFSLGEEVHVSRLGLDMSRLTEDLLGFDFEGRLFSGAATLAGKVEDLNESSVLTLEARLANISLGSAVTYFRLSQPIKGTLQKAELDLVGEIANPETWSGKVALEFDALMLAKQLALDQATLVAKLADGKAIIRSFDLTQATNKITGTAIVDLPETLSGFAKLDATGTVDANLQDLASISDGAAAGAATATGTFTLQDGQPSAELSDVKSDYVQFGENEFHDVDLSTFKWGKSSTR